MSVSFPKTSKGRLQGLSCVCIRESLRGRHFHPFPLHATMATPRTMDTYITFSTESGVEQCGWFSIGPRQHHPLYKEWPFTCRVLQHSFKDKENICITETKATTPAIAKLHEKSQLEFETAGHYKNCMVDFMFHRVVMKRTNNQCVVVCNKRDCLVFLQNPFEDSTPYPEQKMRLFGDLTAVCTLFAKYYRRMSLIFTRITSKHNQPNHPFTTNLLVEIYKEVEKRVHYFLTQAFKVKKPCIICYQDAKSKCPCKTSRYCGAQCQKIDWKDHMHTCPLRSVD